MFLLFFFFFHNSIFPLTAGQRVSLRPAVLRRRFPYMITYYPIRCLPDRDVRFVRQLVATAQLMAVYTNRGDRLLFTHVLHRESPGSQDLLNKTVRYLSTGLKTLFSTTLVRTRGSKRSSTRKPFRSSFSRLSSTFSISDGRWGGGGGKTSEREILKSRRGESYMPILYVQNVNVSCLRETLLIR